jgi:hypothetical protein
MERTHLSRSTGGTGRSCGVPPCGGTPHRTRYFFVTVICTWAVAVAPPVSVTVTLAV